MKYLLLLLLTACTLAVDLRPNIDDTTISLYLDGVLQKSVLAEGFTMSDYFTRSSLFRVGDVIQNGEPPNWNEEFNGYMDNFMLFNKALSQTEITVLYEKEY